MEKQGRYSIRNGKQSHEEIQKCPSGTRGRIRGERIFRPDLAASMKEFIKQVLRALVNYPERLMVAEVSGSQTSILEVRCHASDVGRIIGKNGKTIGALRVLLTGLAAKQKRKAILEVVE